MIPEPSILDFINVYTSEITGTKDENADKHRGSNYESLGGFTAVLWSRQAQRDTDLWRSTRFNDADGQDLTDLIKLRYGIDRILDTYGTGLATFIRPTAGGGAGTIWAGTRIRVATGTNREPLFYVVNRDTVVGVKDLIVKVPIRAAKLGSGTAIVSGTCTVSDPLWDNTWRVDRLVCAEGTDFEAAPAFRSRTRQALIDRRRGFPTAIINACLAAGAAKVVLFASDYAGDAEDRGLNVCYVGDSSFESSTGLIKQCKVALENTRVCGDNVQVLPMTRSAVTMDIDAYLFDSPNQFDQDRLYQVCRDAIIQSFGGVSGGFTYKLPAMAGAVYRVSGEVQELVFNTPASDVSIPSISGGLLNFPPVLTRYTLDPADVSIRFSGPR